MGVLAGEERMNVIVDPTRIKGDRRVFKNVIPASTGNMSYEPSAHNLLCVHEPGTGYRMIALEAVVEVNPAKNQKQSRNALAARGWELASDEPRRTRNAIALRTRSQ